MRELETKNRQKTPGIAFSDALLLSRFQIFAVRNFLKPCLTQFCKIH